MYDARCLSVAAAPEKVMCCVVTVLYVLKLDEVKCMIRMRAFCCALCQDGYM